MPLLEFTLINNKKLKLFPTRAAAAGFTGRNRNAVRAHIAELEEQGIPAPQDFPIVFPILPQLLCQETNIQVVGSHTTPEVEPVILFNDNEVYLTVGSDQTDRALEAVHMTLSKNVCPKPIANSAWPLFEILPHWDSLLLEAETPEGVVQRGTLAELLPY